MSHPQIDAAVTCCTGVVDVVLIPEVPFELESLLDHVAKTLDRRGHVVICTAEGAGQVHSSDSRTKVHSLFVPSLRKSARHFCHERQGRQLRCL